jgi:ferric-dicitrate binding protein FerR (iron transport regulator)
MTKLALHGLRSLKDVQELSEEDRSTYRRWARRSCAVYAIVLAALFAGFWFHDRSMTTVAVQNHPTSIDSMGDMPTSQIPGGKSKRTISD